MRATSGWCWFLLWFLLTSTGTAFREEFSDERVDGPAVLLRPHWKSIGTPLWTGSVMTSELAICVESRLLLVVPVQIAVWKHDELLQLQTAADTKLPTQSTAFALDAAAFCAPCANVTSGQCLAPAPPERRLQTLWLTANATRHVVHNLTIEHDDQYYLSISTCTGGAAADAAVHLSVSGYVQWARSGGGELPGGLLGIVPFYGCLCFVYMALTGVWTYRMRKYWGYTITLQLTLFLIMLANLLYAALAFGYYLHLDLDTNANSHQVFGGIYAGFYQFNDPFAILVATYRFALMSSCQALLTMLCDGLFVLRPLVRMRIRTKAFVVALVTAEFFLLVLQRPLYLVTSWLHAVLQMVVVVLWLLWLGYTSWSTWHSLYAEDDHAAWNTPLKQRVYKAVCRAVFLYPLLTSLVYGAFFIFVRSWQWMWLRMVVFDVWMLIVMVPASYHW